MRAIFKDDDTLVVSNADTNEQILVENFIEKVNSDEYDIVYTKLVNINGDVEGIAVDLLQKKSE